MITSQMEELYQQIADAIIGMIPEEWGWIKLYTEYWDGYYASYFFYAPSRGGEPVYCLDIPDRFEVDEELFNQLKESLYNQTKIAMDAVRGSGTLDKPHIDIDNRREHVD